jgi:hypothetical protein
LRQRIRVPLGAGASVTQASSVVGRTLQAGRNQVNELIILTRSPSDRHARP